MSSLEPDYKMAYEFLYAYVYNSLTKEDKETLEIILNSDSIMSRIPVILNKLKKDYGYGKKDS